MRRIISSCAAFVLVAGCAGTATDTGVTDVAEPADCAPVTSTDLNTEDGWLGLIDQSPENVSVLIDDGRGRVVEHRPEDPQVLASAVKVVHLAAYSRAVAGGALDPDEQVPLTDWERWYVPGTDGGAHPEALKRLGIANDGIGATDPSSTVRLDDMVTAMIQESDNAVPDYLRHRLGDQAIVDAAATGGWDDFEVPSLAGTFLALFAPSVAVGDPWDVANKWAFDSQFRADVNNAVVIPSYDAQAAGLESTFAKGSARELNGIYRALADGSFGDGSDLALSKLEYQQPPEGVLGLGFKGGSFPGVLTQAFELRREDGSTATAVWLIDGLDADRYQAATAGLVHEQALIIDAMNSASGDSGSGGDSGSSDGSGLSALDRIACVV